MSGYAFFYIYGKQYPLVMNKANGGFPNVAISGWIGRYSLDVWYGNCMTYGVWDLFAELFVFYAGCGLAGFHKGWFLMLDVKNMAGINQLSCETVYDTKIMKNFPFGKF
jgi:hypothetical protein